MSYPTRAELKSHLGISGSGDDTPLDNCLSGAIKFVETVTGRVFAGQADTTRYYFRHDVRYFPDRQTLMLFDDLATCTSVIHPRLGALVQNEQYILRDYNAPFHKIQLLGEVFDFPAAGDAVEVTGKWGYSASCPNDLRLLILELAQSAYHGRNSGGGGDIMLIQGGSGAVLRPKTLSEQQQKLLGSYKR